jgi:hypothetical protein
MAAGIRRYNRPTRGYVTVDNSFARSTYTPRAVKVGLFVLSHMDGRVLTQEFIARTLDLSVRTVAEALKDLEGYGLLVRVEERDERGYRSGTEMNISDIPFTDEERAELGQPGLPAESASGTRSLPAKSAPALFAGPKKTLPSKKTLKDSCPPPVGDALFDAPEATHTSNNGKGGGGVSQDPSAVFASFWSVYPRKIGKGKARTAFASALGKTSADDLVTGARRYADYVAWSTQDPRFVKHPTTWLNGECWEDDLPQRPAQRDVRNTDWESDVG